jgi:iron complex transport system ATP-binding protein
VSAPPGARTPVPAAVRPEEAAGALPPRLALVDVAVRLGPRAVLDGVGLTVAPGEVVGLLGRNGAGKTTLLRVAAGTLAPDAGSVLLDGAPLAHLGRRARARAVALVPQDTQVPFPFSVAEVVLMGRTPHLGWLGFESAHDLAIARAALDRMGIAALADRSILALSGGERQLAIVARALAQEPKLLLLDEPTAFLDLRHRLEVLAVVRELAAAGAAALVVSHDLGIAARFCDRLVLLADARVQASGAPRSVLEPGALRAAFGIEADVLAGPDGLPVVVPRALA